MSKFIGLPAWVMPFAAVGLASVGLTSASANYGKYTTRVPESRLFINGGRILRCDLFFSAAPGGDQQIAPKGSVVKQSVPPVVWQYSGLLPVSDYLKTVAIHSVASDDKVRPWQEVQGTFYDGLRTEGADLADAKIAFAGAYAFAPRWPLVEFVEVEEKEVVYPDTVLYEVQYIQPQAKGLSLEDYRKLALQILDRPEDVSLRDIRDTINSADAAKTKMKDRASLGGIGDATTTSAAIPESNGVLGIKTENGSLKQNGENLVAHSKDHERKTEAQKVAEPRDISGSVAVDIPIEVAPANSIMGDAVVTPDQVMPSEMFESLEILQPVKEPETMANAKQQSNVGSEDERDLILASGSDLMKLDGPQDDWIILPDGSMMLRSIQRLVSE